jgi:glycogen debranching enzyme
LLLVMDRTVLKENQIFLVSDEQGDIASHNSDGHGLYWRDTRFLSLYELTIDGMRPTLLSSAGEHNFMNNFQFANPAFTTDDGVLVPARSISIRRNRFIQEGLHERIGFFNYNRFPLKLEVRLSVGSDFRDMFDVRGYTRRRTHGTIDTPEAQPDGIVLRYLGLDGVRRSTELRFEPHPKQIELVDVDVKERIQSRELPGLSGHGDPRTDFDVTPPSAAIKFEISLPPKQHRSITIHAVPNVEGTRSDQARPRQSLDGQFVLIRDSYRQWDAESAELETDNEILNAVIRRAQHDLRLLTELLPSGYVPSAGIPWFSVPFGRDSLITSIQTLCLNPAIAYGTLRFLAAHQGTKRDDWRDEEPGKILHEVRLGEVAALNQVPHTAYYGSVDSTPLFLITVGELLAWTDDLSFMQELRPNVEAALGWIEHYGDLDGDGYVEYASRSPEGIRNQGWKDSREAVAYRDGRAVEPPIALAEVQGYVYGARMQMARYFDRLGETDRAEQQRQRAAELKLRFNRDFWVESERYCALALDPEKHQVPAVSSNPGHCLWTGLFDDDRAVAVAERLLDDDLNCGWGIRTLSSREPMFNPMSYHNGSVWPHDNALIAAGLKKHGFDAEVARIAGEVLEAAQRFPHYRLPELYCGFTRDRRYFSTPAQYPVSCSPQAWAAGSVFLLLQTLLGLRVDAQNLRLGLRPGLPEWVNRIAVKRLMVSGRRVDFEVWRQGNRMRVEISDSGGLEVAVEPAANAARRS